MTIMYVNAVIYSASYITITKVEVSNQYIYIYIYNYIYIVFKQGHKVYKYLPHWLALEFHFIYVVFIATMDISGL